MNIITVAGNNVNNFPKYLDWIIDLYNMLVSNILICYNQYTTYSDWKNALLEDWKNGI